MKRISPTIALCLLALCLVPPAARADSLRLAVGAVSDERYGCGWGSRACIDSLEAVFYSNGKDRLLHLRGYDIDTPTELAVYLNDVLLGYLSSGPDRALKAPSLWWLPKALMVPGRNRIELRQGHPGWLWGVTALGIYEVGSVFGSPDPGDNQAADPGFELSLPPGGDALLLGLTAFAAGPDPTVDIELDDTPIAALPPGPDGDWGLPYQLALPQYALAGKSGRLAFRGPDSSAWGVRLDALRPLDAELGRLKWYPPGTPGLDRLDILIPPPALGATLRLRCLESERPDEVYLSIDGIPAGFCPRTGDGSRVTDTSLPLPTGRTATLTVGNAYNPPNRYSWGVRLTEIGPEVAFVGQPRLAMNPSGKVPLAGSIALKTNVPTRARLSVSGEGEAWTVDFPAYRTSHELPLLGLHPDRRYLVLVSASDRFGTEATAPEPLIAETPPLPDGFPEIQLLKSDPERMEPGVTLFNAKRAGRFVAIDAAGEVVWFLDGGDGVVRQRPDGNLIFSGLGSTVTVVDLLGRELDRIELAHPYSMLHHELSLTDDGNLLSLGRRPMRVDLFPTDEQVKNAPLAPAKVREEPVAEFAEDGTLIRAWPLSDYIPAQRIGYDSLKECEISLGCDWLHANSVSHDSRDDSLIVSIRHQDAVIKISRTTGELKWILGHHANWPTSHQPYLLTPVGEPFDWPYHQHAAQVSSTGTILLFDNGNHRAAPFDGQTPMPDNENASRGVEYEVNETDMTVRQVWQYGWDADERLFSSALSELDELPVTGNRLLTFGWLSHIDGAYTRNLGYGEMPARVIEVDPGSGDKVFEVMISTPYDQPLRIYRSDRIQLYPRGVRVSGP